ncbi:MAG: hypothetical protein DRJ52_04620 [Thermoprotei archaeon]|nr:MAG: hypothetical protein DRJ52_04620 [Thermoprotei archaeon]RLF00733.1 MAG: hypothetical protein DRJ63_01665 [Thermoprotei archaeon]HDI75046.1 hypothetical protein [Thermoprotei archaeon]
MKSIFKLKKYKRSIVDDLRETLQELLSRVNGHIAVLFTREGLPVIVHPENIIDPLEASAQASSIINVVLKLAEGLGLSSVKYLVISGSRYNIVLVAKGDYGLLISSVEPNIGLILSLVKRTLDRCISTILD